MTPPQDRLVDPDDASRTQVRDEAAGIVDFPWDDDRPGDRDALRSDVTCAVPWLADGFEAIQLYVEPVLRDRAEELCAAAEAWSGTHRDIDGLTAAVMRYADEEDLSASIFTRPRDAMSAGLVGIAFTLG